MQSALATITPSLPQNIFLYRVSFVIILAAMALLAIMISLAMPSSRSSTVMLSHSLV